jgi:type VI secretion system secreted protein Hcp
MSYDIFLKIQGIKGDSTDDKHKEWIEVLSYKHLINNPFGGAINAMGDYIGAKASHHDFKIVKKLDSASPSLFFYCHLAKRIPQIDLQLCRAMGDKTPFMKYTFKEAAIVSVEPEGSHDTKDTLPIETIMVRYAQISLEYTPTEITGGGRKGATSTIQVDLRDV